MNAKGVIFLSGKKVNLRPYDREKDLVNCQRWINNPEIRVYIENVFPITLQQEEEAIQRSIIKSRPFGSDAWVTRITKKFGLEQTLRPVGRRKKNGG